MADSNQDALKHKLVQHPAWYDPDTNFGHPRYAFALRVGDRVASVSSDDWPRVESVLMAVWVVMDQGLTWEDARPAIYHAWRRMKLVDGA
jgi:hypothetical protein